MLANVADVDEHMQATSLEEEQGLAVFLDFAAAFPSLCHGFIMTSLRELGVPAELQRYVAALYFRTSCKIKIGGRSATALTSRQEFGRAAFSRRCFSPSSPTC